MVRFGLVLLLVGCGIADESDAGMPDAGPRAEAWAVELDGPVEAVATNAAGDVYALAGGRLHAFDRRGVERWRVPATSGTFEARHRIAGVDDGVVHADTTAVIAYDADGAERWRVTLSAQAVAARGDVVAVMTSTTFVTLDLTDGAERWRVDYEPGNGVSLQGNRREHIVAALPDGGWVALPNLTVFDADGAVRWQTTLSAAEIHDAAVADDGSIVVTGVYDDFVGLDIGLGPLPGPIQFDPYALVFEADGTPRASLGFAGDDFEYGYGAGSDGGRFLLTGHYGDLGHPLTIGETRVEATRRQNAFLAWLESDGSVTRADAITSDAAVVGRSVAWSPAGRWVLGGMMWGGGEVAIAGNRFVLPTEPDANFVRGFLWVGPE